MSRRNRRGANPTNVNGQITLRTDFYRKILYRTIKGIFDIKIPDEWECDYILNAFLRRGYIIIARTNVGVIPCNGTLTGFNYLDYPTGVLVDIPLVGTEECTIGTNCEIVYLERTINRTYFNFIDLVDVYAYKLAAADSAIDVNLINSKISYIIEADTKAQADTIKQIFDEITEGEPFVVYRGNGLNTNGMQIALGKVKENYIADMVQDSKRTIMNEFLTLIGVNNANTDKRERLVTNEVEANNVELSCNIAEWKRNLKICVKRVNRLFPELDNVFDIKLKYDQLSVRQSNDGGSNDITRNDGNVGVDS